MGLKILHISAHYLPLHGGQSLYIKDMIELARRSGHTSAVLHRYIQENSQDIIKMLRVPKLPKYIGGWRVYNMLLPFYRRTIRQYDLVVSHYAYHAPLVSYHPKLIIVSHGVEWSRPPKDRLDIARRNSALWANEKNLPVVANDRDYLQEIGMNVDSVQPYSQVQRNMWYLPNSVDISIYKDIFAERRPVILVPRSLYYDRGVHLAIEAMSIIKGIFKDLTMIVVGSVSYDEYYNRCTSLIQENGLTDRIRIMGPVSREELVKMYQHSTLVLIPTIQREGTSLSALEAMACGTPTISTPVGGLSDLPTYKTKPDPRAIANAVNNVMNNWKEESLRQAGSVRMNFSKERWDMEWNHIIDYVYDEF